MKYNDNGTWKEIYVKALDSMPVGTEVDFDGTSADIPVGWEEVEDKGEIYSTTEQRIGTWIDGKPLYRKVLDIKNIYIPNGQQIAIYSFDNNVDYCFIENGWYYNLDETLILPLNYNLAGSNWLYVGIVNKEIVCQNSYAETRNFKIIINYTKTTDQGGNA